MTAREGRLPIGACSTVLDAKKRLSLLSVHLVPLASWPPGGQGLPPLPGLARAIITPTAPYICFTMFTMFTNPCREISWLCRKCHKPNSSKTAPILPSPLASDSFWYSRKRIVG
jgi:hypothetical protein